MRAAVALLVAAFAAAPSLAHPYSEHGSVAVPLQETSGLGGLVEGLAPHLLPDGVLWYALRGVQGGDAFSLVADDPQEPRVLGLATTCPGPPFDPTDPDANGPADLNDLWLSCHWVPDFDVYFTAGS